MDVESAIRTRRTHKAFAPDPLPCELVDELLELGRWGSQSSPDEPVAVPSPGAGRARGPEGRRGSGGGLEARPRATLVATTAVRSEDPVQDQEDLCATACAVYAVLLAAHGRGLAGYWRTPGVLRSPPGLQALGIPPSERFVALIHLGWPRQEREPPDRLPTADVVTYLP